MNYLIVVNGAPAYKYFFSCLGQELEREGDKVFYAVDARRSKLIEPDDFVDSRSYYFSDYFKKANGLLSREESGVEAGFNDSWGDFIFSDYDRFFTYRYNLRKGVDYWESVYVALNRYYDQLIVSKGIDAVIYEPVSNSFAYVAYKAIKRSGGVYIGVTPSRISGRFEMHTTIHQEAKKIKEIYDRMDSPTTEEYDWAVKYIENLKDVQPDYMNQNRLDETSLISKYFNRGKASKLVRVLSSEVLNFREHKYSYQYGHPARVSLSMVKRAIERRLRLPRIKALYSEPKGGRPYYVYPIHFHPEASTSVHARPYIDEFRNIVNIAFSLPVGCMLYVKDHLSAFGQQDVRFYKEVSKIPNVVLVGPYHNIKSLILGAQGVITITGTAGFEAALLGRPVYVLGNVFYRYFEGVNFVESFEALQQSVVSGSEGDGFDNVRWLIAYKRYTRPGTVNLMSTENDFESIAREIRSITRQPLI